MTDTKSYTKEQIEKIRSDAFKCGFICCLANTVNGHGANTAEYENFRDIGSPSAEEVRRLGSSEYDREAMNVLRKGM